MPMMPKRVKFRKFQRGKMKGVATRGNEVSFGEYGLQALELGRIPAKTIEAARIAASHFLHGEGRIWIRIFPHQSLTAKPLEVRMGGGKGDIDFWYAAVKPGTVLFEIGGVQMEAARQALLRSAHKLPIACRFVKRRHKI
jgi:large subunit ribosomal protein L16